MKKPEATAPTPKPSTAAPNSPSRGLRKATTAAATCSGRLGASILIWDDGSASALEDAAPCPAIPSSTAGSGASSTVRKRKASPASVISPCSLSPSAAVGSWRSRGSSAARLPESDGTDVGAVVSTASALSGINTVARVDARIAPNATRPCTLRADASRGITSRSSSRPSRAEALASPGPRCLSVAVILSLGMEPLVRGATRTLRRRDGPLDARAHTAADTVGDAITPCRILATRDAPLRHARAAKWCRGMLTPGYFLALPCALFPSALLTPDQHGNPVS